MNRVNGLHHITAVAADPQRNLDFYTGVLGLHLVKKTVNQDDPFTYHLYYGDERGRPGTAMTFFPFPGAPAGRPGQGQPLETRFRVPESTLGAWQSSLEAAGVEVDAPPADRSPPQLQFSDPDGLPLALEGQALPGESSVMAVQGFAGMVLSSHRPEATARVLTDLLGYQLIGTEARGRQFESPGEGLRDQLVLLNEAARLPCSGEVDRFYFRSVYFREPGGMLFEIATDEPGFTVDEPAESLGSALKLTAEHESMRSAIEAQLPPLKSP